MKDLKSVIDVWNKFNFILTKSQKIRIIGVFLIMLIGAAFETIGVSIIIPFVSALMDADMLMDNPYVSPFLSALKISSTTQLILLMSFAVVLVYIVKNTFLIFSSYMQSKFGCDFQKELSVFMLTRYLERPYTYFRNVNSTYVFRCFHADPQSVYRMVGNIMKFFAEFLTASCIGIFIMLTDWIMAFGILLVAGICFISIVLFFRNKIRYLGNETRNLQIEKDKYAFQIVNGIKDIFIMNRKDYFKKDYEDAYSRQAKVETQYGFVSACPEKIIEAVCISGIIIVVCGRILSGVDAVKFIPKLSAFAIAAFRIMPSVGRMTLCANSILYDIPAFNALYNNLKEIQDYEIKKSDYIKRNSLKHETNDFVNDIKFNNCIEVKNICWHYEDSDENILNNLNLKINKGESVAFIGHSGAGKSTLADVILGLFQPQSGSVYMDGIDIYTIPECWCKLIGYVPQTIYITDDTIRNNIVFGLPEDQVSDDKVWEALKEAQLKEFVEAQPKGLDTVLGERGVKLSGGQRQRIAIARALYYNPEILVMDEATAALDNETEAAVMESINALQGHKTLIIIAHRLTTVRNCDKIYEIGNGVAVERNKDEVIRT